MQETVCPDRVDPARALAGDGYQFAVKQGFEVLRNRRPADRQTLCQLVDRAWLAAQLLQKIASVGVGDGLESIHGHVCTLDKTVEAGKSFVIGVTALKSC